MFVTRLAAVIAAPVLLAFAAPASAQNFPMVPADYTEMAGITVEDGGSYEYAMFLATTWKKNQEFAKQRGWIKDYKVMINVNKRAGEPDLYLVTTFSSLPDAAEDNRRQEAYRAMMKQSDSEMEAASGDRAKYRKMQGSMLLREMKLK